MTSQTKRLVNLLRGWPSPQLLPTSSFKAAALRALSEPTIITPGLLYGPDSGYQPLRDELARWLSRIYGVDPDPDRICISGGASQSLSCILQSFTDPAWTHAVWMAAPCYFLACSIFEDAGFKGRLKAVPENSEGIDVDLLEDTLGKMSQQLDSRPSSYKDPRPTRKLYRHVFYVVPTCANPSGKTMSTQTRLKLVELARKHDALVICDDVYDFLQWDTSTGSGAESSPTGGMLRRLVDIDIALGPSDKDRNGPHFGHAISNASFSKIVGPGVRTGWVESTPDFRLGLSQTGCTRSGGAPSQLTATIICELLSSGDLQWHINEVLRPALKRRYQLMMTSIEKHLGRFNPTVIGNSPATSNVYGGYFVWVTLPGAVSTTRLADWCLEKENLIIAPGNLFEVRGDENSATFGDAFRLCFSYEDETAIEIGLRRLGVAIEAVQNDKDFKTSGSSFMAQISAAPILTDSVDSHYR